MTKNIYRDYHIQNIINEGIKYLYQQVKTLEELQQMIKSHIDNKKYNEASIYPSSLSRFLRGKSGLNKDKISMLNETIKLAIKPESLVRDFLKVVEDNEKTYYSIRPLLRNPNMLELLAYLIAEKYNLRGQHQAILTNSPDGLLFTYAMSKELNIPFHWVDSTKHQAFHKEYQTVEIEERETIRHLYVQKELLDLFDNYIILIDYIRTGKTIWAMIDILERNYKEVDMIIPIFVKGKHENLKASYNFCPVLEIDKDSSHNN